MTGGREVRRLNTQGQGRKGKGKRPGSQGAEKPRQNLRNELHRRQANTVFIEKYCLYGKFSDPGSEAGRVRIQYA